jgi:hypothetical protein
VAVYAQNVEAQFIRLDTQIAGSFNLNPRSCYSTAEIHVWERGIDITNLVSQEFVEGGGAGEEFIGFSELDALNALAAIMAPKRFLVEAAPQNPTKHMPANGIPRHAQRPICRVMTVGDVVRSRGDRPCEGANGTSKSSHMRKAHWMHLRHPRYGKNQGKRIWRNHCWIGPEEWQDQASGIRYRVRLDAVGYTCNAADATPIDQQQEHSHA